jgi:hypothetical protein
VRIFSIRHCQLMYSINITNIAILPDTGRPSTTGSVHRETATPGAALFNSTVRDGNLDTCVVKKQGEGGRARLGGEGTTWS